MAQRHKISRLHKAVDLARDAAEKVRIDSQACMFKDRLLDEPAQMFWGFGATLLSRKQVLRRLPFKNRPCLRQIKVQQNNDTLWEKIIKRLVVLTSAAGI